jgi:hypothetical protein
MNVRQKCFSASGWSWARAGFSTSFIPPTSRLVGCLVALVLGPLEMVPKPPITPFVFMVHEMIRLVLIAVPIAVFILIVWRK